MNLMYLTGGRRDYKEKPIHYNCRRLWDFHVSWDGGFYYSPEENSRIKFNTPVLILSSPESRHGLFGVTGQTTQVMIFQFSRIFWGLEQQFGRRRFMAVSLTDTIIGEVQKLYTECQKSFPSASINDFVIQERTMLALCEIILNHKAASTALPPEDEYRYLTNLAGEWYRNHIDEKPSLNDIAGHLGYSLSHTRKIIRTASGTSPGKYFDGILLNALQETLSYSSDSLEQIAWRFCFSEPSALSRFYKKMTGMSPSRWRKEHSRKKEY